MGSTSTMTMALPDVSRLSAAPAQDLGARLRDLGITRAFVHQMTERGDDLRTRLRPTREAQLVDDPANIALRLFFCSVDVPRAEVDAALGTELVDRCITGGLLANTEGETLCCPFHVRTVRGLYIFSDYLGDGTDEVMGAGETTAILYHAARPESRRTRALDLGCGAGTLALLLASSTDQTVGTDINDRAVQIARWNARLNGIANASFRVGDVFAPVESEQFDLIVSQPPYYPKTAVQTSQTFLHGGVRGDEIARRVLEGMPNHLLGDGRGLLFTSWPSEHTAMRSDTLRVIELTTNRRELHGTRQSLTIVERSAPGAGWTVEINVPADCWGEIHPPRIDQIIAAETLLRAPDSELLGTALRLPKGVERFTESAERILRYPPESLLGMTVVDKQMEEVLFAVDRSRDVASALCSLPRNSLPVIKAALRRGLLQCAVPGFVQRG